MLNRDQAEGGRLADRLRAWAGRVAGESPIYATLSGALADDPVALAIIGESPAAQPQPHLLFAAVQFLLLGGADPRLAGHYPSIPGAAPDGDLVAAFHEFLVEHRQRLIGLVATRRVQTNDPRRCTTLLPAFAAARDRDRPLALIEIGPSAGLNLLFDRYRYDYGTVQAGPPDSPLTISTEIRAGRPPIPDRMPEVVSRVGLDLHPIDVTDPDAVRWTRALIWPEQLDRIERFETAIAMARSDPPTLIQGDALALLPHQVAAVPEDASLIVYHSYVLNQWEPEDRDRQENTFRRLAEERRIDRIADEISTGAEYPDITHTRYESGTPETRHLGTAHYHGAWLSWEG